MKEKNQEKIIMRHILEVRLRKRIFSFLDFRGHMVDKLNSFLKADQIRLRSDGTRFDVADNNLTHSYFFSYENFGFQIDAASDFEEFKAQVRKFIAAIKEYPAYKWEEGLLRVGTRSVILYHRRHDNVGSIKNAYKELILNNHSTISELTKSEIIDSAHIFDLRLDNGLVNVTTGPVTKEEALQKWFDNKNEYSERFNKDNGLIFSIDMAGNKPEDIKDLEQLRIKIESQVDDVKAVFDGFKAYFQPKE
jgi:hypothetical protein